MLPPPAVGLVQGISISRARASLTDAILCDYAVQNLGYGTAPPLRLWVERDLPPQPVGPKVVHGPVVGPGHGPISVIGPGDSGPGAGGPGDGGGGPTGGNGGPVFTDEIVDYFTAATGQGPLVTLMGPVSNSNTPARPDDPLALSATDKGFPATGPWRIAAVAQVASLAGAVSMKNLPNLARIVQ